MYTDSLISNREGFLEKWGGRLRTKLYLQCACKFREGNLLLAPAPQMPRGIPSREMGSNGLEHTGLGTSWACILWLLMKTSQNDVA